MIQRKRTHGNTKQHRWFCCELYLALLGCIVLATLCSFCEAMQHGLIKSSNLLSSVKAASLLKTFFLLHWHTGKISLRAKAENPKGLTDQAAKLRPSGRGHGIPALGIPLTERHLVRWTWAKATADAGMLIHREDLMLLKGKQKHIRRHMQHNYGQTRRNHKMSAKNRKPSRLSLSLQSC